MKLFIVTITIAIFIFSCNNDTTKRPTTALDTGRDFIRATLDGDFKNAESLLCQDSLNMEIFKAYERSFSNYSTQKKDAYKAANIIVNNFEEVNDSTSILNYSNSYMKQAQKIKLQKIDKVWQVDFKYTTGDSTSNK